jgi:hypothetical protein
MRTYNRRPQRNHPPKQLPQLGERPRRGGGALIGLVLFLAWPSLKALFAS